jgi:hypothetical protein
MAQICLKLELKPKDFPKKINATITPAITAPEVYHGQGSCNTSSIVFYLKA